MAKIYYCKHIPFKGYVAMMLFGFVIVRKEYKDKYPIGSFRMQRILNHELQHRKQFLCTGIIPFYPLYLIEYLIRLLMYFNHDKAYRNISFEREARAFEGYKPYKGTKFWKYLSREKLSGLN